MAFRLTTFAGVTLPLHSWKCDFSTPLTRNPIAETFNGYIDFYGSRRRIDCSQEFELDAIVDPTSANLNTIAANIRTLKTLEGRFGTLVRTNVDGSNSVQRNCRLLWVGLPIQSSQRGYINKMTMRFFSNEPFWRSASTTTHGPQSLTSGLNNWGITVAGEEDVIDAILTITASTTITSITIAHTKTENGLSVVSDLRYTTSLTSPNSLVIDTGLYTAKVGGSGVLANFVLDNGHTEVFWLRLPPGSNTLSITIGGGGTGTATLTYQAAYQ